MAQKLEGKGFSSKRFVLTTAYGGLFNGTVGHAWYLKLDQLACQSFIPGTARFVAFKVIADSIIFGPLHISAFFTVMTLGEGGTMTDVQRKLRSDFWSTLAAEFAVWPAIQAVNFKFVPVTYQLLLVNALTIADATFMSWVQHQEQWLHKLFPQLASALAPPHRTPDHE